jgi:hypothetical protein
VLYEEKLDEICARLRISPRIFLDTPAEKTYVSVTAKKCKKTATFAPVEVNCGSPTMWNKTEFYTLLAYLQRVYAGEIDSATAVLGNGDRCHPSRFVKSFRRRVNGLDKISRQSECHRKLIVCGTLWVKLRLLCPLPSENIRSDWYFITYCTIILGKVIPVVCAKLISRKRTVYNTTKCI